MGLIQVCSTLVVIITIFEFTNAACPRQAQAVSLLEGVISPANAERALKILRIAIAGARAKPNVIEEVPFPRYPIPPNALAARQCLPEFLQAARFPPRQLVSQPIFEVCSPEVYPPAVVTPTVVTEKVFPGAPIPQPCGVQQPVASSPVVPAYYPPAPAPMVNPFLPAASPVSAYAPPTSSLLPPVNPTQVRSNFLRKIPILPPTI